MGEGCGLGWAGGVLERGRAAGWKCSRSLSSVVKDADTFSCLMGRCTS